VPRSVVADHELHGLARIVRHRKGPDFEIADSETVVTVESVDVVHAGETLADDAERAEGEPDRNVVARGEGRHAAHMIGVLVRDDHRRKRFRRDADSREAPGGIAHPESAVDQDARRAGFDHEPVALAAAADRCEAHQSPIRRSCGMHGQTAALATVPAAIIT